MSVLHTPQPEQAAVLTDLCLRSKAVWGYDAAFLEACRPSLTITADDWNDSDLQIAMDGARILGVAQVRGGGLVAELDKLGLREKTVILFSTDNGTAPPGYQPEHDPDQKTGKIGGRPVNGRKGQLLEGGCRVPLIGNWKGTLPAGGVKNDLIDFSDLLPTFADLAAIDASLTAGTYRLPSDTLLHPQPTQRKGS